MIKTREFTFADGLTHGLVGPNGIGKTTLLRKIAGQIQSGGITVFGEEPFDKQSVLNRVILMGIDNPLPDSWGIGKLGVIGKARWPRWDEERFNELLVRFDVPAKAYSALSRGQKSAVGFIFAVASGCEVMLLDEPYLGLDVQNRELFYKHLLQDVERNPRTFILSTHHVDDAARILDSVVLLDKGRITGIGTLDSITERIAILSGSTTAVEATLGEVGASGSVLHDATSSGLRRVVLDTHGLGVGSARDLAARIEGSGVRVASADLEQAVLALTGREF